jgi:N-acetylmuramoyl-L-alanine amidase
MFTICIDAGHGGKDAGASANNLYEKDITLKLALKIAKLLNEYENTEILLTRQDDTFIKLNDRAKFANDNKADFFYSIHVNAATNIAARGYEDYIHTSLSNESGTAKLRDIIHEEIKNYVGRYNVPDRGKKKADFMVLRLTKMPAVLTENLFLTNGEDVKLLKDDTFLNGLAESHVKGIAKAFGLQKKRPTRLYKVQVGAFIDRKNAERLVDELKSKGYNAFIKEE